MSFKKIIDSISDKLKLSGDAISDLIKQHTQYINTESKIIDIAQKRIIAFKNYVDIENSDLSIVVDELVRRIENIEKAREEKIKQIKEKIIGFFQKIAEEEKGLVEKLKKAEAAQKNLVKVQSKIAKLESKSIEKLKPEQLNEAKMALNEAEMHYNQAEAEAKAEELTFNKKKKEIIQLVLKYITNIEKTFHEKALSLINL